MAEDVCVEVRKLRESVLYHSSVCLSLGAVTLAVELPLIEVQYAQGCLEVMLGTKVLNV